MKRYFFALFLVPFLVHSQQAEKNGFDKYVFGSTPADYKELMLEIDEGDTKLYTSSTPPVLEGAVLDQVNLTFLRNKLSCVSICTKNATGDKLLEALKQQFGEPQKSNPQKGSYEWKRKHLQLIYEKSQKSAEASASFYSLDQYQTGKKK